MSIPNPASDAAAFYAAQSPFSDPGDLAGLYAALPADPRELARIARGLVVHRLEGDLFEYAVPQDRLHNDAETRYIDDILRIVIARNDAPRMAYLLEPPSSPAQSGSRPKPSTPGPGRPPGSKNRRPATRYDVGKTTRRPESIAERNQLKAHQP